MLGNAVVKQIFHIDSLDVLQGKYFVNTTEISDLLIFQYCTELIDFNYYFYHTLVLYYFTVLYCILYCTVLYCTMLYCTVLYCIVWMCHVAVFLWFALITVSCSYLSVCPVSVIDGII